MTYNQWKDTMKDGFWVFMVVIVLFGFDATFLARLFHVIFFLVGWAAYAWAYNWVKEFRRSPREED